MKILVIGASGLIGKYFLKQGRARNFSMVGTALRRVSPDLRPLDIRHAAEVDKLFSDIKPDVVVLSAALTNVDYCEDHEEETRLMNVQGPRNVADACGKHGARLAYISTDYVFDGKAGPYAETDRPNPVGVYAQSKWDGEKAALELPDSLAVRTTVVYDWDPESKNFIMGLIQKLSAGERMRVMNDQWGNPTLARNLADAVLELIERGAAGIWNIVGPDNVQRYDFATTAADILGFDKSQLTAVTTEELHQRAPRPMKAGLVTDKARRFLKTPLIGIREGLGLVKKDWEDSRVRSSQ